MRARSQPALRPHSWRAAIAGDQTAMGDGVATCVLVEPATRIQIELIECCA